MLGVLMSVGPTASPSANMAALALEAAALRPLVRGVIAKMLGLGPTDPDVEDATHETLRRAIEGRSRLRDGEPVRPWVVGIAKHVALDAARARKRSRERHVEPRADDDDGSPVDLVAGVNEDPLDAIERGRKARIVREALDALPPTTREALSLFHLEGLGYQEIAARMGVPLGTVATWVSRGRKAMATAIGKEAES